MTYAKVFSVWVGEVCPRRCSGSSVATKLFVDFIEHGESCNSASLLQGLPFQRDLHVCNTGSSSVPVGDKSGSSSLYSFKLFGSCCNVCTGPKRSGCIPAKDIPASCMQFV